MKPVEKLFNSWAVFDKYIFVQNKDDSHAVHMVGPQYVCRGQLRELEGHLWMTHVKGSDKLVCIQEMTLRNWG